jgi:predicted PurR-regulated permease PerM
VRENWLRLCGGILLLAIGGFILWRVRGVVITVLVAVVFAYLLRPLVDLLCRPGLLLKDRTHHLPRPLATTIVFLVLAALVLEVGSLSLPPLIRQFSDLQQDWPRYRQEISDFATAAEQFQQEQLPPLLRRAADSWDTGLTQLASTAAKRGLGFTVHSVGFLVEMILVPIIAFYILADGPAIRRQVLFFVPRRHLEATQHAMDRADDIFARYIKGQLVLCLIAFTAVSLGLWALGVQFYLLLGVVAGMTRAIPIIGPLVGAVPVVIVVLVTTGSGGTTLWVLALFTLMHLLESKLLMPAIIGRQLDLHPVLIIVALLIGAEMGGLLGMFVAAPVLAAARILVAERRAGAVQTIATS